MYKFSLKINSIICTSRKILCVLVQKKKRKKVFLILFYFFIFSELFLLFHKHNKGVVRIFNLQHIVNWTERKKASTNSSRSSSSRVEVDWIISVCLSIPHELDLIIFNLKINNMKKICCACGTSGLIWMWIW